jgi:hypothetical protein
MARLITSLNVRCVPIACFTSSMASRWCSGRIVRRVFG